MPTLSTRVTDITQDLIAPKVVETVLGGNFLAARLFSNGKKWMGERMRFPVKVTRSATGGSFSGLDTFNTNASSTTAQLVWAPTGYYQSVVIPSMEKAANETSGAGVINLVKFKMDEAGMEMADDIGTILYGTADGTGKDFTGLGNIVDDSGSVGGLSRATYSTLQATDTAPAGGTLTLGNFATLYNDVSLASSDYNSPTYFTCPEAVWNLYEALLTPTVRHTYTYGTMGRRGGLMVEGAKPTAGQGFRAITFRGKPVVADEKATTGYMIAINENFLHWYGLQDSDNKSINLGGSTMEGGPYTPDEVNEDAPGMDHGFQWRGWIKPSNQAGMITQIISMGNVVCTNPKRFGRLTGLTNS